MYRKVDLNEVELERLKQIFACQRPRSWQELRQYYLSQVDFHNVEAPQGYEGYPQFSGDDELLKYISVEYWLSDHTLSLFWSYMLRKGKRAEFYGFLSYLLSRGAYIWEFRNYWEATYQDYDFKRASVKKVPKNVKKQLSELVGCNKNLKYFFSGGNYYAVKHPDYDFLVTVGGSIVLKESKPVYMLLNAIDVSVWCKKKRSPPRVGGFSFFYADIYLLDKVYEK